jgi:hypothetical protein
LHPNKKKHLGVTRMSLSRRTLLKASAATFAAGGISAPYVARAQGAEFTYKFANNRKPPMRAAFPDCARA